MANENFHHGNSMSLVLFLLMTYCCFLLCFVKYELRFIIDVTVDEIL